MKPDPASGFAAPQKFYIGPLHKIGGCMVRQSRKDGKYVYHVFYRDTITAGSTPKQALLAARDKFPNPRKLVVVEGASWDNRLPPEIVYGEILAYRVWNLRGEFLVPATHNDAIFEGPMMRAHELPTPSNTSGLYAVKGHKMLKQVIRDYKPTIYGEVGLLGRVVELEHGYRAEQLIVRKLFVLLPFSPAFRKVLEDRYQCEVLDAEDLSKAVRK